MGQPMSSGRAGAARARRGSPAFALLVALLCAGESAPAQSRPSLPAHPAADPISVDGRLDEPAWREASAVSGFRQFEPTEGAPAAHPTEVRVLYGPNSLYIGAVLHDDDPAAIEQTLGRRDDFNRADWFLASIDSYHDRRTAYTFGVNAAGVQFDAIRTGEGGGGGPGGGGGGGRGGGGPRGMDASWDAIWYSEARVTPEGWVVEMRIPYSMLRFPDAESQTWGIHFSRRVPRAGEQSEWPLVPRAERANLVAQFGLLTGIEGVEPRRNLQVNPYSVARVQRRESPTRPGEAVEDGGVDIGGDVKLGLGPNVTLNATVNPDFGQVEADPAVLNLTAFETRFDERRPFFVEGSQIYRFAAGPGQLLYTRRIGAVEPILGAAKLSGRTADGLSFGVLGATTGEDFSPTRHYGVARVSQQIGAYSSAGGVLTTYDAPALDGEGRLRSVAAGADWDLRFRGNRFGLEGFAAATHRRGMRAGAAPETGFAGKLWARKRQGAWTGFAGADLFSDDFNPNDVGQLQWNNSYVLLGNLRHEINGNRPFGPVQRASVGGMAIQRYSYRDGLNLGQSFSIDSRWMLRGFQQIELGASVENPFGGYDLYETRGLGPWARPFGVEIQGEISTDERRSWQVEPELSLALNADGGRGYGMGVRGNWSVSPRLSLSGNLEGEWENDVVAWSSNETLLRTGEGWMIARKAGRPGGAELADYVAFADGGLLSPLLAGVQPFAPGRYFVPVFGARDTRSLDLTLRSSVTFTTDLSLQLYSQLFLATGRYDQMRIQRSRDDLVPFAEFPKRAEFAFSSLQSNAVLRWEYRPGSALFVVWSHGRRARDVLNPLAPWGASPYDRALDQQITDTFGIFPDNVLLLKLSYAFLN